MRRQLQSLLTEHSIEVSVAAVVKSPETQIEFVKAGAGMALVPGGIERLGTDRSVTFYSFSEPLHKRAVAVMWRKDI